MGTPLNVNDGWEAVINEPGRQGRIQAFHLRRRQNRLDALYGKIFLSGTMSALIGAMGIFGALTMWLAAPVTVALFGIACFYYGRVRELKRHGAK